MQMMSVTLHKKGLLHQVREISLEPKKVSFGGEGIQLSQHHINMTPYLTPDEVSESRKLVKLLLFKSSDLPSADSFETVARAAEKDALVCKALMTEIFESTLTKYFT